MAMDLEKELKDLKRRVDLAETPLPRLEGRFEFIPGQLGDMQLYMHNRFEEIDARFDAVDVKFDAVDARFDVVEGKIDALRNDLPDIVASGVGAVMRQGD
jgi:hypothetical protein